MSNDFTDVNIGSGNNCVPSGNKPHPGPMLTKLFNAVWRHQATMSWFNQKRIYFYYIILWNIVFDIMNNLCDISWNYFEHFV